MNDILVWGVAKCYVQQLMTYNYVVLGPGLSAFWGTSDNNLLGKFHAPKKYR